MRTGSTFLIICLFWLFVSAGLSHAMDVTLVWDHSPSPDVAGYLLYYKSGSEGPPYDGTGANEGDSPIDVGYDTTYTVRSLADYQTYYFALKAYDYEELQSNFSNEVNTDQQTAAPGLPAVLNLLLE